MFEQTYTRFLDLQKAEKQAREAEIEASLERVRSKGMAMHSTDEIESATAVVFNELSRLGIDMERCGITLFNETPIAELWSTTLSQENNEVIDIVTGHLDFRIHPMLQHGYREWKDNKDFSIYKLVGEEVRNYYSILGKQPNYHFPEADEYSEQQILQTFNFNEGGIFVFTKNELSDEEKTIFKRFTRVFEQTYTRFLDLKKAEEQAREAEIEASLERVRSKGMAMNSTDEIESATAVVFEELSRLGIEMDRCGIILFNETPIAELWSTTLARGDKEDIDIITGHLDFSIHPLLQQTYDAWLDRKGFSSYTLIGDEVRKYYSKLAKQPEYHFPRASHYPEKQIVQTFFFEEGVIFVFTEDELSEEEKNIFKRFTRVFEQTYTRFLDLQKAEKLAVESSRQASLDRIRAEIASMRSADDLQQITPIIWDELNMLEIPFIRCGVFIMDEEKGISHTYLSTAQGEPIAALHLPVEGIPLVEHISDAWKKREVYTEHWDEQDFREWTQNLIDQGHIASKKKYEAGSAPESLDLHFLPFKQGMLYIGNTEPLSEENLDLGQSVADAFSVAYDRYEDFNKLEQAKLRIEEAFRELEAAQEQLVQQEKLASLGQLTAGIAHEIKNPLNFVNNFSDVSVELIQEARDEIKLVETNPDMSLPEDALEELSAILDCVESNLRKIHEHGSRADGIVKSMLEHSKGGSGKTEQTNLNALVREFANLSYHGMRAGKHPIDVDIDLQLDDSIGDVSLVAEDFSRVIVNLCTNAFDAMREKQNSEFTIQDSEEYKPTLKIRTHNSNSGITIEIEDNGPGIPKEIKDKIMQPFFTTKKGTQGTGLGLSITNDIVKAHGGILEVHSRPGQTVFSLTLNGH